MRDTHSRRTFLTRDVMQAFADKVWNDSKVHNQQRHLIKFEEWTSAHKLRGQAVTVQIYACLAWDPSSCGHA